MATELHKSRKLAEAEHAYRQVLATSPNHALALFCFAQVLEQKGDYSAATKAFRSLAKVQPGSKKAQVGIARNLALQGKLLHAAAAYRQFVEQSPDFAPARHGLAVVLCKMNQLEEALDELRSALNLEPKSSKAQSLWCSAIAAAAKRFPYKQSTFATVSSSLADAMQAAGQRAFAVRCYRQALELQPELTAAHMGLQQLLIAERSASVLAIPAVSSTVN